jgi:HAMP domain-containing protein
LALGAGAVLGLISAQASGFDLGISWLGFYWYISLALMYGLLAWVILGSVATTRLNAALHRLPLSVDILNPAQFEAVGRQSLILALVFIGGITLSLLLSFQPGNISEPSFWVTYLLLVLAVLLIFFLNMRPSHRVLTAAKQRELEPLQRKINASCRELAQHLERKQETGSLPAEINALVAYEQRLRAARTWPYNTTILRTLFFSVLIPLGSVMVRQLVEAFLR